jgi:hypothetical protein
MSATAAGAIQGRPEQYIVKSGFDTDFVFSRYNKSATDICIARDTTSLDGQRTQSGLSIAYISDERRTDFDEKIEEVAKLTTNNAKAEIKESIPESFPESIPLYHNTCKESCSQGCCGFVRPSLSCYGCASNVPCHYGARCWRVEEL